MSKKSSTPSFEVVSPGSVLMVEPDQMTITAYPNPGLSTEIYLETRTQSEETLYIEIVDVLGRIVASSFFTQLPNRQSLKLSELINGNQLARGIYYLKATSGGQVAHTSISIFK